MGRHRILPPWVGMIDLRSRRQERTIGIGAAMIQTPKITRSDAQLAAVIRLVIPRSEIRSVAGPAIAEVMTAVHKQGVGPAGPVFSHHYRMSPETFDFEVGVPVTESVEAAGRVEPSELPAATVARCIYTGPYEGLGEAWGEFGAWIKANNLTPAEDLWEIYLAGPDSSPDPDRWLTELNRPLVGYSAETS